MRRFLLLSFCVLVGSFLALRPGLGRAQAIVHGQVTGPQGEGLPGVHVRGERMDRGAATDADGRYRLRLNAGRHVLVFTAVGYRTVREEVALSSDDRRRVDVTVEPHVIQGDEIVVTGSMREQYRKDAPVKVSVVSGQRLQQGQTSANLMDLVGRVGGLSTQLNCGVCGTNAIRVNGVEGPNTAVLIDGMPIMGALASVYGLNGISPSIIDQVEVIRGPQSTLYGTQALGGVVNIITKDPSRTPTFSADAYVQSTQEGSLSLAASPEVGRVEGFVSGNGLWMDHFIDDNGDGFADVPRRSRGSLFAKGTVHGKNEERRLSVIGKVYAEDRTGGTRAFSDRLRGSGTVYGESIYTRRAEVLTEIRPPGLEERLQIRGALTIHSQDSYYGTEHYDATQHIGFGQATWRQQLREDVHLLTGATLRVERYNDNTPATPESSRRAVPGVFSQGEWSVRDVTIRGGLRVDRHGAHGFIPAPRLAAKYSPSPRTTVRASAGTGFRVVNVFTEDHAALTGARRVVFRDDLNPERSRSVTASAEHIVPFGTNPATIGVDAFFTRFSNKIIPDYDQDPNLIVYENLDGTSVTRGLSVAIDQNFTAVPVSYNLSFTRMDVYTKEGGRRRPVTYAPTYSGTIGVTYDWRTPDITVAYTGQFTGRKRMPDAYVDAFGRRRWSPRHSTHDVKVTKSLSSVRESKGLGVEAHVSVENIFDYTQGSPLVAPSAPFSDAFDTVYTWGPVMGRTVSAGVRVTIR